MLYFLKLGGSLITDKNQAHSERKQTIQRLAAEIAAAMNKNPDLRLLLGHGSGSFGHTPANKYGTRQGVRNLEEWRGFVEVWREARSLNQIVVEALYKENLPVISFPPSAMITAEKQTLKNWDLTPIKNALDSGLIPLVYGDVIFDLTLGGTIFSTEELFIPLALELKPEKVLIAGKEEGVWQDFPEKQHFIRSITAANYSGIVGYLQGSSSIDVTGGMIEKVKSMYSLTNIIRGLEVMIFSGEKPTNVFAALMGKRLGTFIKQ